MKMCFGNIKKLNYNDMDLQDFIVKFAELFDEKDVSEFEADTEFKALDGWSSLFALSVIGMIDEEYGVTIKGSDVRESETIEDLFHVVKRLKG